MKPEVKTKWLEALRSGEYKQGLGTLHDTNRNTYCCLGVACDLYQKAHPDARMEEKVDRGITIYEDESAVLPHIVRDWMEVSSINPSLNLVENLMSAEGEILMSARQADIAGINDVGATFEQIADLIEAGL